MNAPRSIDGVLVQWGERLFYPRVRRVPATPGLAGAGMRDRAAAIRLHIERAVRRPPQVMVKVTGGGRGMAAIAAHLRYISKNGRLPMEDDRGNQRGGREALNDVADQWRFGGSRIPEHSERREAYNLMLSMPRGTDPLIVQRAAREFAQAELAGHRYVMVLHDHQANPHVHLSVRAESRQGRRLNPRKADLQRWRETFAERLRGWGIEAEATRQATRGIQRDYPQLWRLKAGARGTRRQPASPTKTAKRYSAIRIDAMRSWATIARALSGSIEPADRQLAAAMKRHLYAMPVTIDYIQRDEAKRLRERPAIERTRVPTIDRDRPEPEWVR
jgi:hypothetical protein